MTARVTLLAKTEFVYDGFLHDAVTGGEALAEFAGRACYQSWDKPNPKTATNEGYLNHILQTGHLSVLEHGSVTFYIQGISRSLTHELVRHRHFAYSQLSQRYVDSSETEFVIPPEAEGDDVLTGLLQKAQLEQIDVYEQIVNHLTEKLGKLDIPKTEMRKRARQTGRAVLGNHTETKIVVTGNYRAWRHFITMRASAGADREIRGLAIQILRQLVEIAPAVFSDYQVNVHPDGSETATSIYHEEM